MSAGWSQAGPDLRAYAAEHGLVHIARHADLVAISSDPGSFCSSRGVLVTDAQPAEPAGDQAPATLLHADPPRHTRYRRLVQPAFGPAVVRALEPAIRARVRSLLSRIDAGSGGTVDAVAALALPLPLAVIADLLGVDGGDEDLARFAEWSDAAVPGVTDLSEPERRRLLGECFGYLVGIARSRRERSVGAGTDTDSGTGTGTGTNAAHHDVVSRLAAATVDGEHLSDAELAMFLVQLLVAGNETTRHSISGGLLALAEHPREWQRLRDDRSLIPSAVEEILRWTAPVRHFLRTAREDRTVNGCPVAAGQRVLLDYRAAGFDPARFAPEPEVFDVGRKDNPHLAFGFGPHFCLGAPLARLELLIVLDEILDAYSGITLAGTPEWNGSPVVYGLRALPLRLTPS